MQVAIVNTYMYMCVTQCGVKTVLVHCVYTAPSSPPRALNITMITSSSFHLLWTEPLATDQNGLIRQYTVQVIRVDSVDSIEAFTYDIDSLVPYTNYEWRVAGQTVTGTGPFSSIVIQQTLQDSIYTLTL